MDTCIQEEYGKGKLRLEVGLFEELGTVVRNKNKKWQFEEGMAGLPLLQLTGGIREEGTDKVRRLRVNKEDGDRLQHSPAGAVDQQ